MTFKSKLLLITCAFIMAFKSYALPEDQQQPISLEADQAKLNHQTGLAEYQGNVIIIQGTAQLRAEKVILHTQEKEITRMEAFGSPAQFQQILQAGEEPTHITGDALDLNLQERSALVTGNGKVHRGTELSLFGEKIQYSLKTGELMASSEESPDESKGRVKMIIQPTTKPAVKTTLAPEEN